MGYLSPHSGQYKYSILFLLHRDFVMFSPECPVEIVEYLNRSHVSPGVVVGLVISFVHSANLVFEGKLNPGDLGILFGILESVFRDNMVMIHFTSPFCYYFLRMNRGGFILPVRFGRALLPFERTICFSIEP
jgi:hypothetical protein